MGRSKRKRGNTKYIHWKGKKRNTIKRTKDRKKKVTKTDGTQGKEGGRKEIGRRGRGVRMRME